MYAHMVSVHGREYRYVDLRKESECIKMAHFKVTTPVGRMFTNL